MRSCVALLLLGITGCFPAQWVSRPAISGRVLDRDGHAAPNVPITIRNESSQQIVDQTRTERDGTFTRPVAGKRWFVYFLPQDNAPPPQFTLSIVPDAAETRVRGFSGGQIKAFGLGPDRVIQLGEIRLP
jgi:hypothetical protein